ncbi:hypothetical protein, partial [Zoogloea sp.]|uniref:hypothetical protein n=1 Tax=Zoogloea sp. TaxID=49181 RepID=UPI0035B2BCEC
LVNHCHAMVDERLWRKHKVYQTIAKGYSRPRTGQENMSMGLCGTVCLRPSKLTLAIQAENSIVIVREPAG